MNDGPSRRSMLAALGASIALAGCTESIDDEPEGEDDADETDTGDDESPTEAETPEEDDENGDESDEDDADDDANDEDTDDDADDEDDDADDTDDDADDTDDDADDDDADDDDDDDGDEDDEPELPRWPAIETGEVISEFESDAEWTIVSGTPMPRPDEARAGREALELESEGDSAEMAMAFPDGLDLEGWDLSMAIKAESAERVAMEVIAPERGDHLTASRLVPAGLDDWFRVDFGYTSKHGSPDLSNVTELRLTVFGPEGGPTRFLADDLRRTPSANNGKAILTFYGGIDSHRSVAVPLLAEREWPAALPIDPRTIGDGGRMDLEELAQLRDRGWDVCSYPAHAGALSDRPVEQQRDVIEDSREFLAEQGFEDGARHFFAPDDRLARETLEVVREVHESGFLFGYSPTAAPPTGIHTVSLFWGMALHEGVRRQINLADQYNQLVVIRVPRIVEDDAAEDASGEFMPVSDVEHLLSHIDNRGLDVITPSELLDGDMAREDEGEQTPEEFELEEGTVLDAGEFHEFSGSGDGSTGSFDLQPGIAVASFDHDGSGEFVVRAEGDLPNDLVVSTAGSTLGESVVAVAGGSYSLVVEADGEWTIEVEQPEVHSDDVEALPVSASGTGSSVIGPLWTEGDVSLTATHDGDGEFIIDGYDTDGGWEQVAYDGGEFDSNRSYSAGGVVWLNVEADGDWTIDVE